MKTEILVGGIILFILGIMIAVGSQEVVTYSSEECSNCGGDGALGIWPLEITCTECDGSGMVDSRSYEMAGIGIMIGGVLALLGFILIIAGAVIPAQQIHPPSQPYIQHIYPSQPPPHPQQPTPVYIQPPVSQPVPLVTSPPPVQTPVSPPQQTSQEILQIHPKFDHSKPFFCGRCGKQIEVDTEFCSKCGTKILWSNPPFVGDLSKSSSPPNWMTGEMIFRCPRCDTPAILTEGRFWCNTCSTYCTDDFRRKYPIGVENIRAGMPSEISRKKWYQMTINKKDEIATIMIALLIGLLICVSAIYL